MSAEEQNAVCDMLFSIISLSLRFPRLLHQQLGDTNRSISDFGYSEVELVLCFFLKQMWISHASDLSVLFFQRLGSSSWRSMKLLEAFIQCMKCNNASDFSLSTDMHKASLNAYYNNGFKQVASDLADDA